MTGAGGLFGRTLVPLWRSAGADVQGWTRADFDVADAPAALAAAAGFRPDVIVHGAAWTDVDGAEKEPEQAMRVNRDGTAALVAAAAAVHARLVYLSTDYVFDGSASAPIAPDAPVKPLGSYGRSKAAGEQAVRSGGGDWLIVRTGWTYGPGGKNFVDTMRAAAGQRRAVKVVSDQQGAPTSARLVAEALWGLVGAESRGTFHIAAAGETSWHGVARLVYEAANADPTLVSAQSSRELNRPAPRPAYSVLDCRATVATIGANLPRWDEQVRAYLKSGVLPACGLMEAAA